MKSSRWIFDEAFLDGFFLAGLFNPKGRPGSESEWTENGRVVDAKYTQMARFCGITGLASLFGGSVFLMVTGHPTAGGVLLSVGMLWTLAGYLRSQGIE
jgi:hypothetical protein